MIKKLLSAVLLTLSTCFFSQTFSGMYHFTGVQSGSSSTGVIDPTPVPTANGLIFGSFSAVGFTSAPQANGAFAFKDWGIGATNGDNANFTGFLDDNKYYEVTLTPILSSTVCFSSISFFVSRSSTGPRNWAVRSSLDSYSVNLPASISPANANLSLQFGDKFFWALDTYTVPSGKEEKGCTISLGNNFVDHTNPITFRFYAYNSESSIGTFRIDTVTFTGLNVTLAGLNKITYDPNSNFSLYPNPSNDGMVFIEEKNGFTNSVEVLDALGKIIFYQEKENTADKIKLDLGSLPNGIYFIRSLSTKKTYTEKLIISK